MVLYNITFVTDNDIKDEFREWVIHLFLPDVAKSELFKSHSLLKVKDSPNEGETFSLQLIANSDTQIVTFQQQHLPLLHEKVKEVWSNKIFFFESKMEYLVMY